MVIKIIIKQKYGDGDGDTYEEQPKNTDEPYWSPKPAICQGTDRESSTRESLNMII